MSTKGEQPSPHPWRIESNKRKVGLRWRIIGADETTVGLIYREANATLIVAALNLQAVGALSGGYAPRQPKPVHVP